MFGRSCVTSSASVAVRKSVQVGGGLTPGVGPPHTVTPACPPHAVYDSGSIFPPNVLDISQEDLLKRFMEVRTHVRICAPKRAQTDLGVGVPSRHTL